MRPLVVIISSSMGRKRLMLSSLSMISMTSGKSSDSRKILALCRRLDFPKPIAPRKTVARERCTPRPLSRIASKSGEVPTLSSSPMKIRSSTACFGICMSGTFQTIDTARPDVTEPHRQKRGADRCGDVRQRSARIAGLQETERFQAEGREGRGAAAEPGHHELPLLRTREQPSVRAAQRGIEADDKRAGDIDKQGGPRKRWPKLDCQRRQVTRDAAEHAAGGDTAVEQSSEAHFAARRCIRLSAHRKTPATAKPPATAPRQSNTESTTLPMASAASPSRASASVCKLKDDTVV